MSSWTAAPVPFPLAPDRMNSSHRAEDCDINAGEYDVAAAGGFAELGPAAGAVLLPGAAQN